MVRSLGLGRLDIGQIFPIRTDRPSTPTIDLLIQVSGVGTPRQQPRHLPRQSPRHSLRNHKVNPYLHHGFLERRRLLRDTMRRQILVNTTTLRTRDVAFDDDRRIARMARVTTVIREVIGRRNARNVREELMECLLSQVREPIYVLWWQDERVCVC